MRKFTLRNAVVSGILMIAVSLFSSSSLFAQDVGEVVNGKVVDSSGNPVSGASILNVKSGKGTSADKDGNFSLRAVKGQTLQISFVGYQSTRVVYKGQTNLAVTLLRENAVLGDVVVIGYGTQRKEAVTGSVASISGNNLREVPTPNISAALQGRLPGVAISQTSSQPGATMQIRIRGTRSLTATNDPLVVLDGLPFPGNIADIDMNNVKSLDVLKDASATAIYGSRGANGVILITTYKGTSGQDPRIALNSYYGVSKVFSPFPMMNGPQFAALRKAAGLYKNQDGSIQLGTDESLNTNTNWQNLLYQTGKVTNEDISVSAGTKRGSYSYGASYYENDGVIPTQSYKRYSLHGAVDQRVGKYLRLGFTTNNNYNYTQGSQVGLYNTLSNSPLASPYKADGSIKYVVAMPLDQQWVSTKKVLDSLKDNYLSQQKGYATYNSVYGELQIPGVPGLAYRVNVGLNLYQINKGSYTAVGVNSNNPTAPSTASSGDSTGTDWTIENLLTYDRSIGKHQFNAMALYSTERTQISSSNISGIGVPADALQYYNIGTAGQEIDVLPANQYYSERGLKSWMGRLMYSYDNRYLISATIRSDGASVLAPGHQWHTYPAVSAGWNVANESFMRGISLINLLKLRVGYGETSNQAVVPYSTLGVLSTNPYNFGASTYATGYYVSQLPNASLSWEYSKTWNYGIDFALLDNRLSGTVEYYITKTNGLLQSVTLPPTSGVNSYVANVGNTQNKGIEFSLDGTILKTNSGWTWDAGVNMSFNRNKITRLNTGVTADQTNWWFVGKPINVIYDYKKIGLWKTSADSASGHENILQPGGNVGEVKVLYTGPTGSNGTPTRAISPDDRQVLNADPNFIGGFNTRVAYKGFDLSAVGIFQSGGILISTVYGPSGYLNLMSGRRNNIQVDYWTPTNINAKYPKPGGQMSGDNPQYASTLGYFSGSYVKVRSITLGYNFAKWLRQFGIPQARLYVTAQNPFVTLSPYHRETGLDPETNSYGDQYQAVTTQYTHRLLVQGFNTPATRSFLVGLNITF
ncbi:TonB-dependent receptor [Puia sp.]|uniref:SusC/RagA family TonB-linked outer membrane protein n=1 Tax=Puia sp. TaxID=2045100 RepID=UPI002F3E8C10